MRPQTDTEKIVSAIASLRMTIFFTLVVCTTLLGIYLHRETEQILEVLSIIQ